MGPSFARDQCENCQERSEHCVASAQCRAHTHTPKILVRKKTVFTFVNCSTAGVLLFKPLVDTLRFPRISIALNYLR